MYMPFDLKGNKMKRRWRDVNRISFMVQIIASVLILLLVSSVLIRVYQVSIIKSKEAEIITRSTRIVKISAEFFSNRGSIDDVKTGWEAVGSEALDDKKDGTDNTLMITFDQNGNYKDSKYIESASDRKNYINSGAKNQNYVMKVSLISDDGADRQGHHAIRKARFSIYYDGKKEYSLPCKALYMTEENANE